MPLTTFWEEGSGALAITADVLLTEFGWNFSHVHSPTSTRVILAVIWDCGQDGPL